MLKRFVLFGFGVIISIFFLSLGPENRMKKTFYAYVDYFSINKRVITHLYSDTTIFTNIAGYWFFHTPCFYFYLTPGCD